ncbi:MAG: DUF3408 domain-containing protein [Sphingobacteriaceae bacterium]|nr:DUF3408 domain-containing protein [Sphingobacteriaceae bacterium]
MERDNTKRNTPDIDEKLMMEMMVDGVQKDGLQNPTKVQDEVEAALEKTPGKTKGRSKRSNDQEYEAIFFKKPDTNARDGKTVYIRPDFHVKLSKIVQVIGEDKLTIYAYLDNLLAYHFEEFGDEITKSYNDKYKPIL